MFGSFYSVLKINLPLVGASIGSVYYCTDTREIFLTLGDLSLVALLEAIPVQVAGPTGPTGPAGPQGEDFIGTVGFFGNWQPSPVVYQAGSITSYRGFLYMSTAALNISNNTLPPSGNPFWKILGPSTFAGQSSEIIVVSDGAGQTVSTGGKGFASFPYNATITSWTLISDQPGSASFDIGWNTYAGLPTVSSIVSGAGPSLASQQKNQGTTSGWSKTVFDAGDVLSFSILTATTVQFLSLTLQISAS
jgi:hypothetical protein